MELWLLITVLWLALERKNSFVSQIVIAMKLCTHDTVVCSNSAVEIAASLPIFSHNNQLLFSTEIHPTGLVTLLGQKHHSCVETLPHLLIVFLTCCLFSGFSYCPSYQQETCFLLVILFTHHLLLSSMLWFLGFGLCQLAIDRWLPTFGGTCSLRLGVSMYFDKLHSRPY